jgi:hypothetical protein
LIRLRVLVMMHLVIGFIPTTAACCCRQQVTAWAAVSCRGEKLAL